MELNYLIFKTEFNIIEFLTLKSDSTICLDLMKEWRKIC